MKEIIFKLFGEPTSRDKGVRGTSSGKLFIDKKVFYNRAEVKAVIKKMENSESIKKNFELAK
ncbi:hypothetical protein [Flavicella sp.]|uniref:hypothetical protein n=1 Tax=Flavicella sp. TaxID=2957742 RepID=UPI0026398866|nr:hypothetical protein [Flavicella sp.]MDG1803687.1 hypothetical protein [Flavicella sp.]MDG2279877.1 hypothetical protein [Flavicella sp.]